MEHNALPLVDWLVKTYAWYPMIGILFIMITLDILSGICAALVEGRLSSKVSFPGMMKKASILLVVGMAAVLEHLQPDLPLAKLTAGFFIINEALSILENARRAGVPIPPILSKSIDAMYPREVKPKAEDTLHVEVKGSESLVLKAKRKQPDEPTLP